MKLTFPAVFDPVLLNEFLKLRPTGILDRDQALQYRCGLCERFCLWICLSMLSRLNAVDYTSAMGFCHSLSLRDLFPADRHRDHHDRDLLIILIDPDKTSIARASRR